VSRCSRALRGSAEGKGARSEAGRTAKRWPGRGGKEREEEIGWAARRRGAERGEPRKVFGLWTVVSCSSRNRVWWRTELDLGSRKSLDDHHGATALGAEPKRAGLLGSGYFWFGLRKPRVELKLKP
jgi:hypothetical protein